MFSRQGSHDGLEYSSVADGARSLALDGIVGVLTVLLRNCFVGRNINPSRFQSLKDSRSCLREEDA